MTKKWQRQKKKKKNIDKGAIWTYLDTFTKHFKVLKWPLPKKVAAWQIGDCDISPQILSLSGKFYGNLSKIAGKRKEKNSRPDN